MSDPSGVHEVPPEMGEGFDDSLRRDLITLLVGPANGASTVKLLPEEGADGHVFTVLEVNGTKIGKVADLPPALARAARQLRPGEIG